MEQAEENMKTEGQPVILGEGLQGKGVCRSQAGALRSTMGGWHGLLPVRQKEAKKRETVRKP